MWNSQGLSNLSQVIINKYIKWKLLICDVRDKDSRILLRWGLADLVYVVETAKTNVKKCPFLFPFLLFIWFIYSIKKTTSIVGSHWLCLYFILHYYILHYTICLCLLSALLTVSNLGFLLISFEKVKVQFICNASRILSKKKM